MNELKLILPYPPSVNNLYATFGGRRIVSAKGRKFKADIAVLANSKARSCSPVICPLLSAISKLTGESKSF